jgi:hypothetical protein
MEPMTWSIFIESAKTSLFGPTRALDIEIRVLGFRLRKCALPLTTHIRKLVSAPQPGLCSERLWEHQSRKAAGALTALDSSGQL